MRPDTHTGSSSRQRLNRDDAELARSLAEQIRRTLEQSLFPTPTGEHVALTVERAPEPIAPAQLARAHPGGPRARRQAEALYARCLDHYREELRPLDEELDDLGAAMANFVAANLGALQGTKACRSTLFALERQLGSLLRKNPAWARASASDRRMTFEKFAILAVFVGECATQALREGPAAIANVQRAARGYLQAFLGVNPDRLALGPAGLRLAAL